MGMHRQGECMSPLFDILMLIFLASYEAEQLDYIFAENCINISGEFDNISVEFRHECENNKTFKNEWRSER